MEGCQYYPQWHPRAWDGKGEKRGAAQRCIGGVPVSTQRYGLLKQYRMPHGSTLATCLLISENAECWWQGAGVVGGREKLV